MKELAKERLRFYNYHCDTIYGYNTHTPKKTDVPLSFHCGCDIGKWKYIPSIVNEQIGAINLSELLRCVKEIALAKNKLYIIHFHGYLFIL